MIVQVILSDKRFWRWYLKRTRCVWWIQPCSLLSTDLVSSYHHCVCHDAVWWFYDLSFWMPQRHWDLFATCPALTTSPTSPLQTNKQNVKPLESANGPAGHPGNHLRHSSLGAQKPSQQHSSAGELHRAGPLRWVVGRQSQWRDPWPFQIKNSIQKWPREDVGWVGGFCWWVDNEWWWS